MIIKWLPLNAFHGLSKSFHGFHVSIVNVFFLSLELRRRGGAEFEAAERKRMRCLFKIAQLIESHIHRVGTETNHCARAVLSDALANPRSRAQSTDRKTFLTGLVGKVMQQRPCLIECQSRRLIDFNELAASRFHLWWLYNFENTFWQQAVDEWEKFLSRRTLKVGKFCSPLFTLLLISQHRADSRCKAASYFVQQPGFH